MTMGVRIILVVACVLCSVSGAMATTIIKTYPKTVDTYDEQGNKTGTVAGDDLVGKQVFGRQATSGRLEVEGQGGSHIFVNGTAVKTDQPVGKPPCEQITTADRNATAFGTNGLGGDCK